jgi:hypothetical protein
VGQYKISTEYALVTINIRAVPSIVLDENPAFKNDLKSQITAASVKLDSTKIDQSCRGARYDIFSLGFRSPSDLAFGLAHLGAHAGFSIKDTVSCLTSEYATVAVASDDRFWSSFPADFRIRAPDIAKGPTQQPTWDAVRATLDRLVLALARYARNDPPPAPAMEALTKLLADQVTVIDNTTALAFGGETTITNRFDAVKILTGKGYIRFGCYAPVDTASDQQVDGATSMFLVFDAPNDVQETSVSKALVIRPQFESGTVKALAVSDNRAWIVTVLKDRDYDCNGFSVAKPAQPNKIAQAER